MNVEDTTNLLDNDLLKTKLLTRDSSIMSDCESTMSSQLDVRIDNMENKR